MKCFCKFNQSLLLYYLQQEQKSEKTSQLFQTKVYCLQYFKFNQSLLMFSVEPPESAAKLSKDLWTCEVTLR
jgi:hypothetical protein